MNRNVMGSDDVVLCCVALLQGGGRSVGAVALGYVLHSRKDCYCISPKF